MWWLWAAQMHPFVQGFSETSAGAAAPDGALERMSRHGVQACCQWTPADGFYGFSENWAKVTGQLPEDCMGQNWRESWHSYLCGAFDQALADMFSPAPEDRTESVEVEGEVMHGSGEWVTLQLVLVHSGGIGGRQQLGVLVANVSEQKDMQQQVALAELKSLAVEHCRASFLSNMSHELRTPLNAMMGFAQMLESGQIDDDAAAKDYLKHIRLSGEDLLSKIADLIELANIDAGEARLRDQPMNVSEALAVAIEMQSHRAFEKGVALRQQSSKPHVVVRADRARLLHCLTHLISQAIDHSHEGGEVVMRYHADANGVELSVEDDGAGLTARRLQNIRTSLHRRQSYYQTDIEDITIGLSMCKEIMELHGGSLMMDSAVGRGTRAVLQLPPERIVSLSGKVKRKSRMTT